MRSAMKNLLAAGLLAMFAVAPMAPADEQATTQPAPPHHPYIPPEEFVGHPGRDTAGIRGLPDGVDPNLGAIVIAPIETGITHFPAPKFVFYLTEPTNLSVLFSICENKADGKTLVEWNSDSKTGGPMAAGLHMIDLSTSKVALLPNVLYRWTAVIRVDWNDPSKDRGTSGLIRYDPLPADDPLLRQYSSAASNYERALDLLDGHDFYDAVAQLYMQLLSDGNDAASLNEFNGLMTDVQLKGIDAGKLSPAEPANFTIP